MWVLLYSLLDCVISRSQTKLIEQIHKFSAKHVKICRWMTSSSVLAGKLSTYQFGFHNSVCGCCLQLLMGDWGPGSGASLQGTNAWMIRRAHICWNRHWNTCHVFLQRSGRYPQCWKTNPSWFEMLDEGFLKHWLKNWCFQWPRSSIVTAKLGLPQRDQEWSSCWNGVAKWGGFQQGDRQVLFFQSLFFVAFLAPAGDPGNGPFCWDPALGNTFPGNGSLQRAHSRECPLCRSRVPGNRVFASTLLQGPVLQRPILWNGLSAEAIGVDAPQRRMTPVKTKQKFSGMLSDKSCFDLATR